MNAMLSQGAGDTPKTLDMGQSLSGGDPATSGSRYIINVSPSRWITTPAAAHCSKQARNLHTRVHMTGASGKSAVVSQHPISESSMDIRLFHTTAVTAAAAAALLLQGNSS
jgi:hypothetical protein